MERVGVEYAVKGRHEHVVEWLRGEGCGGL